MTFVLYIIALCTLLYIAIPLLFKTYWRKRHPETPRPRLSWLAVEALEKQNITSLSRPIYLLDTIYKWIYAQSQAKTKRVILFVCEVLLYALALPLIVGTCLLMYPSRRLRLEDGKKPRLAWGPYPNQSWLEISRALRDKGYESDTIFYYNFSRIWKNNPFDFCLNSWLEQNHPFAYSYIPRHLLHPFVFIWLVTRYDIFHGSFFPAYLQNTPFERLEIQLLHLAGCKVVRLPIGGDVCHMTSIDSLLIRQGIMDMYPHDTYPKAQRTKKKFIDYNCQHADFIMGQSSYMVDTLPRWDLLTTQYAAIDTDYWKGGKDSGFDGKNGIVTIGHSPNHRPCKGSNFLIRAVNELRDEGYSIDLVLLEGYQNDEVREILRNVDIFVADLVLQGYAVMGMEGLSLGKPVVQDISDPHYNRVFKLYTGLDEAPFVSTPIEEIKENLRTLIESPTLRKDIGRKSREYALKYHSYEAVSKFWMWIYDYLWFARRERISFYHPDWPISTLVSLNAYEHDPGLLSLGASLKAGIEDNRNNSSEGRISFYPYNAETSEMAKRLYLAKSMRSNDILLINEGDTEPSDRFHLPQRSEKIDDIIKLGLRSICLMKSDVSIETRLLKLADENPDHPISVNDLGPCQQYPTGDSRAQRHYRKLSLEWGDTVVEPLHFTNFAYINYLKQFVRKGESEILDAFSGPGTVGLSIASETDPKRVDFFEYNPVAAEFIKRNIKHNFKNEAPGDVFISDCFSAVPKKRKYDFIIGNPPHNLDEGNEFGSLQKNLSIQAHKGQWTLKYWPPHN